MLVELGPVTAADVRRWTRFARRIITELRVDPGDLRGIATDDLLGAWSELIDAWSTAAEAAETFRWSRTMEAEVGEYLLHGLDRCFHSPAVRARMTKDESVVQQRFTVHVIRAFVDALEVEGVAHEHYASQVRGSLGNSLDS